MKLDLALLMSTLDSTSTYNAIYNAHGLYNSEQFVLRLSPKNHSLIDEITDKHVSISDINNETIQAYSTYLHETIHWWQHIGSTTGFILSLCYPLQTHSNYDHLKNLTQFGLIGKSIKKQATNGELSGKTHLDNKQALLNQIINNTLDFEFFKKWLLTPQNSIQMYHDPHFESQGHCFHIAYTNVCSAINQIIKDDRSIFHDNNKWVSEFDHLTNNQVMGYYYESPIFNRKIGVVEIFEGQACFNQMSFLANVGRGIYRLVDFKNAGMLHGVYEKAFNIFISISGLSYPESVLDPVVSLFLLICDLAINPMEGFPCEIVDFDSFVNVADPGIRFEILCNVVAKNIGELHNSIKMHSKEEYMNVSTFLSEKSGLMPPQKGWKVINKMALKNEHIQSLMHEHKELNYQKENVVIRIIFSHFIDFTLDKLENPEFFCWPGYWKTLADDLTEKLWLKHLSLFSDKMDDNGIYIRKFENIKNDMLKNTLNDFFANNLAYNLCRQWVLVDGQFDFNFNWLSEKNTEQEWRNWADKMFEDLYGVKVTDIQY